jgi:hypothetical protein
VNTLPHEYTIIETQGAGHFWVCSCSQRGEIKARRHHAERGGDMHINYFNSKQRNP